MMIIGGQTAHFIVSYDEQAGGEPRYQPETSAMAVATPGPTASTPDMARAPAGNAGLPVLSLPKGGAIRVIGEKFSTNPVTGTGT